MARRLSAQWQKAAAKTRSVFHASHVLVSVPHGIDSQTFLKVIGPEIRAAVPLMHDVKKREFEGILNAVVTFMKDPEAGEKAIHATAVLMGAKKSHAPTIFTGVLFLIKAAVRNRTLVRVVERDLALMKVPPHCTSAIVGVLRSSRFELEDAALEKATGLPTLADLQWRVDVALASSHLAKVMVPTVVMQMTLSDGNIKTFEVPIDKFNELRYNVAKVLQEMTQLERHPVLKLAFDLDKQQMDDQKRERGSA